jgi:hypothetical protein
MTATIQHTSALQRDPNRPASTYDEANISEKEQEIIRKRVEALSILLDSKNHAKYIVQARLLDAPPLAPMMGFIEVWKYGGREHAESFTEKKMYFCPSRMLGRADCEALIPEEGLEGRLFICPRCGKSCKPSEAIGEFNARITRQLWAHKIAEKVEELGRLVEIHTSIYAKGYIQANELAKTKGDPGFTALEKKADLSLRRTVKYPFANLIRDLNAGASLEGQIRRMIELA